MIKKIKDSKSEQESKKVWSFFILAFPTVLIIAIGMLSPGAWWVNVILAIYQFIMLKQFLDNYYETVF